MAGVGKIGNSKRPNSALSVNARAGIITNLLYISCNLGLIFYLICL